MENSKNYIFSKPLDEIIKERISIRTYATDPIEENTRRKLEEYLKELKGPFDFKGRFGLIDSKTALNNNVKLGTYGMIKGASSYVVSAIDKADMNLLGLGYELEKFILYATSLGLGTCWMGGTFSKGEFAKAMDIKENEILPVITPVGYSGNSRHIIDSFIRTVAGSKNRKAWGEIFFDGSFDKSLTEGNAGVYAEALEMVRLAPSASNKQPWRIVKENDKFHFYMLHAMGYSGALGFDMQKIDMGIAMCHFELYLKEHDIIGKWIKSESDIAVKNKSVEYVITWTK